VAPSASNRRLFRRCVATKGLKRPILGLFKLVF